MDGDFVECFLDSISIALSRRASQRRYTRELTKIATVKKPIIRTNPTDINGIHTEDIRHHTVNIPVMKMRSPMSALKNKQNISSLSEDVGRQARLILIMDC